MQSTGPGKPEELSQETSSTRSKLTDERLSEIIEKAYPAIIKYAQVQEWNAYARDELIGEGLIQVIIALRTNYEPNRPLQPYIIGIMKNVHKNLRQYWNAQKRRPPEPCIRGDGPSVDEFNAMAGTIPDPHSIQPVDHVAQSEFLSAFREAKLKVGTREQDIIDFYILGMSTSEIAAELGMTVPAFRKAKSRLRKKLNEMLARYI